MNKKQKIIKGGASLAVVKVLQQIISFSVNAVLAIILNPEIFGIIAIVTIINGFISIFTNFGFGASVIQKKRVTKLQLSSLFWLDLITSVITFIVVFISAPIAANIYNNPEIQPLLRLISINFLIVTFFSLNRKLLEKKLEFNYLAISDISATLISSIAGIVLALFGFKAYSLVWQTLILNIAYIFIIRFKNNWFPDLKYDWKSIKDLVFFTLKYKAALTINYLERNIDFMVLGRLFPPYTVGLYSFAYSIMYMPVKRITYTFSDVLFPSFSSVNDNLPLLKNYLLRALRTIAIITFPLTVLIFFEADFLVNFLFGQKWNDAIILIKILGFAGSFLSIDFSLSILPSINKIEISIYTGIVRVILIAISVYIGSFFGVSGVAYGILISKVIISLANFVIINKQLKITMLEFLSALKGPLFSMIFVSCLCFSKSLIFKSNSNLITLIPFSVEIIFSLIVIYYLNKNDIDYFYLNYKNKTS